MRGEERRGSKDRKRGIKIVGEEERKRDGKGNEMGKRGKDIRKGKQQRGREKIGEQKEGREEEEGKNRKERTNN